MAMTKYFVFEQADGELIEFSIATSTAGRLKLATLAKKCGLDPDTVELDSVGVTDDAGYFQSPAAGNESKHPVRVTGKPAEVPAEPDRLAALTLQVQSLEASHQARSTVQVSGIGSKFETLTAHTGLHVRPFEECLTGPTLPPVVAFEWDTRGEGSQSEEYGHYIQSKLGAGMPSRLAWLKATPSLLDSEHETLPFRLVGTTDYTVIVEAASGFPASGLVLLLELKKSVPVDLESQYLRQTMTELVLANVHSAYQPIAVLTDLRDHWTLCWMQGTTIWFRSTARQNAVEVLVDTLHKFGVKGGGDSVTAVLEGARRGGDPGDQAAGDTPDTLGDSAPHKQDAPKRKRSSRGSAGAESCPTAAKDMLESRGWDGPQVFNDECIDAMVSLKDPEVPDAELDHAINLAVLNKLRSTFMCI